MMANGDGCSGKPSASVITMLAAVEKLAGIPSDLVSLVADALLLLRKGIAEKSERGGYVVLVG